MTAIQELNSVAESRIREIVLLQAENAGLRRDKERFKAALEKIAKVGKAIPADAHYPAETSSHESDIACAALAAATPNRPPPKNKSFHPLQPYGPVFLGGAQVKQVQFGGGRPTSRSPCSLT